MIFDIKKENELIANGTHFWCKACVSAKPIDDSSPDQRYCLSCYDVLKNEASNLDPRSRPKWYPRDNNDKFVKSKSDAKNTNKVSGDVPRIMHTVNDTKNQSVHNYLPDPQKRGPKHRELPDVLIKQLAGEGMGAKAISYRLKKEGIEVHYSTIQRRLKGQGVLL